MTNRNIGSNLQHPTSASSTATSVGWRLSALSLATVFLLSACDGKTTAAKASDQPPPETATATTPATSPAAPAEPVVASYTPPTAQVLYQMVAPIALYPDKLVAQILAGATYPDQISAAESWVGQNPGMQKTAMLNAVNTQAWDPSVKSLTEFPNVLGQLAGNIPWTTALGKAYYNDPSDVMNAVQVMRSRAYQSGTLKTSRQLKVNVGAQASAAGYTPSSAVPASVRDTLIAPPAQLIQIEPAQANTVYVPRYDPQAVYGEPMPAYHGYQYVTAPPPPAVMGAATPVVTGLLGFGAGVLLADSMNSHPWGWNSWNVHWGEPGAHWRTGNPLPPMQARPAVVYNNQTYVSRSHTVVNNIRRTEDVHVTNVYEGSAGPMHNAGGQAQAQAQLPVAGPDHGGSHAGAALAAAAAGTALATGAMHAARQNPVNAAVPAPSVATSVAVDNRRQPSMQMPMPMNPAMTAEHGRAGNTAGNAPVLPPVMAPAHAANGIREAGNPQRLAQNPGQMQTRPTPLQSEREQAQQRAQLQHTQADMQAQQHMAQQQQQQAQVQAQMQAKQHQAEMNAQAQQQVRQQQMHQQEQQQQQHTAQMQAQQQAQMQAKQHQAEINAQAQQQARQQQMRQQEQQQQQQHTAQMQAQQQAQQQAQAKAQEAQMREQQAQQQQQQQQRTAQMRAQQQAQQQQQQRVAQQQAQQQQRAAQQQQAQQHAQAAHSQPREREAPKRREHE